MKTPCDRIGEWLDDETRPPIAADLAAHAPGCDACRNPVALERALREGLRDVAAPDAARRAALVNGILRASSAAPPASGRRGRTVFWSWAAIAAAAAIILAAVLAWPQVPRNPISPTEVFGDFLGPLVMLVPPAPQEDAATAPPAPSAEVLTADDVFGVFWSDFEGPLAVALGAMEAPRVAAGIPAAAAVGPTKEE
ncbi:MAG: hypothetical protein FJ288_06430 [Planctomycetes bacterium]|nr:hypothetical protein [Planctomycetota bacterium]